MPKYLILIVYIVISALSLDLVAVKATETGADQAETSVKSALDSVRSEYARLAIQGRKLTEKEVARMEALRRAESHIALAYEELAGSLR